MQGCPFFAGIKKEDAAGALALHNKILAEKKFNGANEPEQVNEQNNQDMISAAMNAFSQGNANVA